MSMKPGVRSINAFLTHDEGKYGPHGGKAKPSELRAFMQGDREGYDWFAAETAKRCDENGIGGDE